MAFGAFAPMPLRLGGTPETGWTAEQHARLCADLVAEMRSSSIAVLTVSLTATPSVSVYHGHNGVGLAHAPSISGGAGEVTLTWAKSYPSPLYVAGKREIEHPWRVVCAQAYPLNNSSARTATATVNADGTVTVRRFTTAGALSSGEAVVEVWGTWIPEPKIGTYGGDPNKRNNTTEHPEPYAAAVYRDIQSARGTAYTKRTGTFVHAENLAMARFWAYHSYRLPEKMRANAQPARSDERLPYWQNVLGVAPLPGEEKWRTRQRCAAAYVASGGPTRENVVTALQTLLGDVFVAVEVENAEPLSGPPEPTYWPGVNSGPDSFSIGGGCWASRRSHLVIRVQQPPDMSDGAFRQLMDQDMFALLDPLLPAWVTWNWATNDSTGFLLGISRLGYDAL